MNETVIEVDGFCPFLDIDLSQCRVPPFSVLACSIDEDDTVFDLPRCCPLRKGPVIVKLPSDVRKRTN